MSFSVTERAYRESRRTNVKPQLVFQIDGVSTLYGAVSVERAVHIGDDLLEIGNDWRIGGVVAVDDQAQIISFDGGTSTSISQQLQPDRGAVNSVSSVQIALIDKDLAATRLVSPGFVVNDILGRKAKLWMGFQNTAFPDDYISIFTGVIDDVNAVAGLIKLNVSSPEALKRQDIFVPVDVRVVEDLDSSETDITLEDASHMPRPVAGPLGGYDSALGFYIRIHDEIIRYAAVSGNTLTGCTRAEMATAAVAHTREDGEPMEARSIIQFEDTGVNIALKTMLSGVNDYWVSDVPATRYINPDAWTAVPNSIFFQGINLNRDYGVTEGDYVTVTGAANGANNCSMKVVNELVVTDDGSYMVVADVTFVVEPDSAAVCAFRSRFDTLGFGLAMTPDQVDVAEHVYWNDLQLANFNYRFQFDDKVNGKDFLDKEVYLPMGAYSLPRQGRASMGYTMGGILRGVLNVFNRTNIKNPDKIAVRRSTNRNFYNAIIYKYNRYIMTGKPKAGTVIVSGDSQTRIPVGLKALTIDSMGMRTNLDADGVAQRTAQRFLGRYQFAAEYIEKLDVFFKDAYMVEPGDLILLDPAGLNLLNIEDADRDMPAKAWSVINKSLNLKTGEVLLDLTDTNRDLTERYGVVSPSSLIVSGTTTRLKIQESFGGYYPGQEWRKWANYTGMQIRVHSADYSFDETVTLLSIDATDKSVLILDSATPLSGAPSAGYIIDIADYPDTEESSDNSAYKAVHTFSSATIAITAGLSTTSFTVAPGDAVKFQEGSPVRIRNADYSQDTDELDLKVESVVGTTVTLDGDMGFTPSTSHVAESLNFKDDGGAYRFL